MISRSCMGLIFAPVQMSATPRPASLGPTCFESAQPAARPRPAQPACESLSIIVPTAARKSWSQTRPRRGSRDCTKCRSTN